MQFLDQKMSRKCETLIRNRQKKATNQKEIQKYYRIPCILFSLLPITVTEGKLRRTKTFFRVENQNSKNFF